MKFRMIALFVSAVSSVSAFADDMAQAQEAVSHASRMQSAAEARVKESIDHAYTGPASLDSNGTYATDTAQKVEGMKRASAERVAADAQMRSALADVQRAANPAVNTTSVTADTSATAHPDYASEASHAKFQALTAIRDAKIKAAQEIANYGVKKNPEGTPVNIKNAPVINATSYRLGITQQQQKVAGVAPAINAVSASNTESINVAASSLPANTPVTATVNGVTTTTTAGAIAAIDPSIQVAVPHVAAFRRTTIKGGTEDKSGHASLSGHDGRGSDNAHSHAFGGHGYGHDNSSSEGFGGHSHFH